MARSMALGAPELVRIKNKDGGRKDISIEDFNDPEKLRQIISNMKKDDERRLIKERGGAVKPGDEGSKTKRKLGF